eukprot:TRINITY_DN5951_c0_g1_i1.p1 TRINITY_DN5951_c0_g1~~TRINITY_DN5951_c0_g1_i1.p1  ORF type:complete len:350 (-),score=90.12 TRINITY_DN5951_c0_g1_i1:25-960(-)
MDGEGSVECRVSISPRKNPFGDDLDEILSRMSRLDKDLEKSVSQLRMGHVNLRSKKKRKTPIPKDVSTLPLHMIKSGSLKRSKNEESNSISSFVSPKPNRSSRPRPPSAGAWRKTPSMGREALGRVSMLRGKPSGRHIQRPKSASIRTKDAQKSALATLYRRESKVITHTPILEFVVEDGALDSHHIVHADVQKLDAAFEHCVGEYIGFGGISAGEVSKEYVEFVSILQSKGSDDVLCVQTPIIIWNGKSGLDSVISFEKGGFIFAVLRDVGIGTIPVLVDEECVTDFTFLFLGYAMHAVSKRPPAMMKPK